MIILNQSGRPVGAVIHSIDWQNIQTDGQPFFPLQDCCMVGNQHWFAVDERGVVPVIVYRCEEGLICDVHRDVMNGNSARLKAPFDFPHQDEGRRISPVQLSTKIGEAFAA